VICFNVIIGLGAKIPPFSKIILSKNTQTKEGDLGEGGKGRFWIGTPIPTSQDGLSPEQLHQVLSNASKELIATDFELNLKDLDDEEESSSQEFEEIWVSSREKIFEGSFRNCLQNRNGKHS